MFINLLPSFVAPMLSYVTSVFIYNLYIIVFVCMSSYVTRMYSYVLVCYSYVTRMYSYVLVSVTRLYSYVSHMYSCGVLVTIHQKNYLSGWICV